MPPIGAKETVVVGCGRGPAVLRQPVLKDGERPSRMPVTGDQEHACGMEWRQTARNKLSFSIGGVIFKRTDADLPCHVLGVLFEKCVCVFRRRTAEIAGVRRGVQEEVFAIAGAEKLHAMAIAFILAIAGEHDDYVRFLWMIADQHAAGESGKQSKNDEKAKQHLEFPGSQKRSQERAPCA